MAITIHDILKVEKELRLDDYIVDDVPIWRIFRRYCRDKKLRSNGINRKSKKTNIFKKCFVGFRNTFFSFIDMFVFFCKCKEYENVVFPYPRLQKVHNLYCDKFTDPVIKKTILKDTSCLFVFSFKKSFRKNRYNADVCYHFEIVSLFVYISLPFVFLFNFVLGRLKPISSFYAKVQDYFALGTVDYLLFHIGYLRFKIYMFLWNFIFKKIGSKRLFCVVRENFMPQIVAAHKLGIPVYEFQHGAVLGDTVLYSGIYNPFIDADYILSVGQVWSKSNFGIPANRILNIGWAYKDIIKENTDNIIKENHVLIISSPHITQKILNIAVELSKAYPTYKFDIRCHPKEEFSQAQKNVVLDIDNLNIVDNTIESYMALMPYRYVLGENSSVLYEAFSIGKIVGRFNFNGISIRKISIEDDFSFFYLNKVEDFERFVQFVPTSDRNVYYSDFNPTIINNLPIHR